MAENTNGNSGSADGKNTGYSDSIGFDAVEPTSIDGGTDTGDGNSDGNGDAPKRRGRPKGSRNSGSPGTGTAKEAKVSLDVSGLESILLSVHSMLAAATGNELLSLSPEEAKTLATAAAKVQRHYPMKASAQALDWANLVFAMATVYGTRVLAFRLQAKQAAEEAPANVTLFPFGQAGTL